jgi:NTE family protein
MVILAVTMLAAGCSSYQPWTNLPARADAAAQPGVPTPRNREPSPQQSIIAALTLSGGGARAAAFGLGVLHELKATRFEWDGRPTTLLDQVSLISGVSGGSILAAHYAAFGDSTLDRFEAEFLHDDVESGLIGRALAPATLHRLTSPWFGRSHVLAERLDALYQGRSFGDLAKRSRGPELLVTATDLTTGAPFEFTPEQFELICSDWASVPLSFAVASSSAVPLLLTPMTLRNHADGCAALPVIAEAPPGEDSFRTRMLQAAAQSYLDVRERPFLHLVDGGLSDNLGMRALLDRLLAGGSIQASFRDAPPGSIRRLILIAVNSERDVAEKIDQSGRVPSTGQVIDTLVFGAGTRESQTTLAMLNDDVRRWSRELEALRGSQGSPFAPDAEIHVVSVSLRDVADPLRRRALLQVPTAFTIDPADVSRLKEAGREALRGSPALLRLRRSLGASHHASVNHSPGSME